MTHNIGSTYPTLRVVKGKIPTDGWGFLSVKDKVFTDFLDAVVLHKQDLYLEDPSIKCCQDESLKNLAEGDSPFLCTSSIAKFSHFLEDEGIGGARLAGFSEVLQVFQDNTSLPKCSFITRAGVELNLCPRASDTLPKVRHYRMFLYSLRDKQVFELQVKASPQLDWFFDTAQQDEIPMCLWRASLRVEQRGTNCPQVMVDAVGRCSNPTTAKWITGIAKSVVEKVQKERAGEESK